MPIAALDSALRRGLGKAGQVIGTQWEVYRLGGLFGEPNAANSIIDPLNLVQANFPMRDTFDVPRYLIENEEIYKMLYLGLCDPRRLKIGDVLVETGPNLIDTPDGRVLVFADVQPLLPPIFIRTEIFGALSRPHGDGPSIPPLLGLGGYEGESKFSESICSLEMGLYRIPGRTIPAVIPMGIQPRLRLGSSQEFKFPTATHRGLYVAYCPLLPGVQVQPGDVIMDQNANRYVVHVPTIFETGIKGVFMQCESLFT